MEEIEITQIEVKEDSQAKLAAVQDLPTKNVLFANEFNAIVNAVKNFNAPSDTPNIQEVLAQALIEENVVFNDTRANKKGIEYAADFSASFTPRSLVDKSYVDSAVQNSNSGTSTLAQIISSPDADNIVTVTNTTIIGLTNGVSWQDPGAQGYTFIKPGLIQIKSPGTSGGGDGNGNVTITTNPLHTGNGNLVIPNADYGGFMLVISNYNPNAAPTPTSPGTKGEIRIVGNYVYFCIAKDTWTRVARETTWS